MADMKYFSGSLTWSRSSNALLVYFAARLGSPVDVYQMPSHAYATARLGSSSTARLRKEIATGGEAATRPELKAFKASSEGVVASSRGVSNFCSVPRDSPSLFRI